MVPELLSFEKYFETSIAEFGPVQFFCESHLSSNINSQF